MKAGSLSETAMQTAAALTHHSFEAARAAADAASSSAATAGTLSNQAFTALTLETMYLLCMWLDVLAYEHMAPASRQAFMPAVFAYLTQAMTDQAYIDEPRYLVMQEHSPRVMVSSFNPETQNERAREYGALIRESRDPSRLVDRMLLHATESLSQEQQLTIEPAYRDASLQALAEIGRLLGFSGAGGGQAGAIADARAPGPQKLKLTRDQNREEIQKYAHVRPAPTFGPLRCFASFPGRGYSCTLKSGHDGPHVAHTFFKKVMAVWED